MKQFIDRIKAESFTISTEDYMLGGLRVVSNDRENREFNTVYELKEGVSWLTKGSNKADYDFNLLDKSKEDREYKKEVSVYFPKEGLDKITDSVSGIYVINKMLLDICFSVESNIISLLKKNVKIIHFRDGNMTNKDLIGRAYSLAPSPFNIIGGRMINKMLAVEPNLNTDSNIFSSKSLEYDELLVIPESKVLLTAHIARDSPLLVLKLVDSTYSHDFVGLLPICIDLKEGEKGYVLSLSIYYDLVMSKTNDNEILGDIKVITV